MTRKLEISIKKRSDLKKIYLKNNGLKFWKIRHGKYKFHDFLGCQERDFCENCQQQKKENCEERMKIIAYIATVKNWWIESNPSNPPIVQIYLLPEEKRKRIKYIGATCLYDSSIEYLLKNHFNLWGEQVEWREVKEEEAKKVMSR